MTNNNNNKNLEIQGTDYYFQGQEKRTLQGTKYFSFKNLFIYEKIRIYTYYIVKSVTNHIIPFLLIAASRRWID